MFKQWFTRQKYNPVFAAGPAQYIPIAEVPRAVAALSKSFFDHQGKRTNIEFSWMYTGTSSDRLDRAWFPIVIGFQHESRDVLDGIVSATAYTLPAIAVAERSRLLGLRLYSYRADAAESGFSDERSTFVSSKHLILDRPLAAYLDPDIQQQVIQSSGKALNQVTDDELVDFVIRHPLRKVVDRQEAASQAAGPIATLHGSMRCINSIGTRHSHYPLRAVFEQLQRNRYSESEWIVDGHVHEALTEKRIGGDPWLQKLADRYGAVKAASTLSLFDVQALMEMELFCRHFGVSWVQYAARELFVIDDDGNVVAHSVFNVAAMSDDELNRFVDRSKVSLGSPSNAEARLEFHDMMQEYTVQKRIDEPLAFKDYAS